MQISWLCAGEKAIFIAEMTLGFSASNILAEGVKVFRDCRRQVITSWLNC